MAVADPFADMTPNAWNDYGTADPYGDLADPMAEEAERQEEQIVSGLLYELEDMKERAVRHKQPIEARWIQDERQYWGLRFADIQDEAEEGEAAPPVDNKTAEKVEMAAARCGDMLFPTNDHNWDYKPPETAHNMQGEQVDAERAKRAVKIVRGDVRQWLSECQYAKHGRRAIHDSCRLGVGVLKGPYPRLTTKRVMREQDIGIVDPATGQVMQKRRLALVVEQSTTPAVTRVDPWMFFPLPCRSMEECPGAFEMHQYAYAHLVRLAKHPGFDADAVRRVAQQRPSPSENESTLLQARDQMLDAADDEHDKEKYIVWEYHGPLEPRLLERLGYLQTGQADPLDMFWGEVWFCQGEALKVQITDTIGDERVPYYAVPYRRDAGDIMGSWGIPRIMHDSQRVIDITWEAMVHNTKLTAGPQVVYWEGKIVPQDGKFNIRGPKAWKVIDSKVTELKQAVQFENIQSVVPQIQPVYEMAVENANQSTQLPMLAHGEAANPVQQTASGMQMVFNAQNIVQRKFAHNWDDEVTIPLLTRYYWWHMQHDPNPESKVDMTVDPRGASYLMVKDTQVQHAFMALSLVERAPSLAQKVHVDRLAELALSCMDLPTERLLKTEEELANAQPTPEEQFQQAMMQAELEEKQGAAAEAMAKAEELMAKVEIMRQNGGVDPADLMALEREAIQAESASEKVQAELMMAQMKRDERMAELALQERTSLAEIQRQMESSDKDRQMKAMLEESKQAREDARKQRDQVLKGFELRLKMEDAKAVKRNQAMGFDSVG